MSVLRQLRRAMHRVRGRQPRQPPPSRYTFYAVTPILAVLLLAQIAFMAYGAYDATTRLMQDAEQGKRLSEFISSIPDRRSAYVNDLFKQGKISGADRLAEQTKVAQLRVITDQASRMLQLEAELQGWSIVTKYTFDTVVEMVGELVADVGAERVARVGARWMRWLGSDTAADYLDELGGLVVDLIATADGLTVGRHTPPDWKAEQERIDRQLAQVLQMKPDALLVARLQSIIRGIRLYCNNHPREYPEYLDKTAKEYDQRFTLSLAMMRARFGSNLSQAQRNTPWEDTEAFEKWLVEQSGCPDPDAVAPRTEPPSAEPDLKAHGWFVGGVGIQANQVYVGFFSTGGAAVEIGAAYDLPDDDPSGCKWLEYHVAKNEQLVSYNASTAVLQGQVWKRYGRCGQQNTWKSAGMVPFHAVVNFGEDVMRGTLDGLPFEATVVDASELPW